MSEKDNLEEVNLELVGDAKSDTCPVCKHPACDKATEIYYGTGKDVEAVVQFFKNQYKKDFNSKTLDRHFKEHVEKFVKEFALIKERKIEELRVKIAQGEKNTTRVSIIKEIIYDFIKDVYASKPDNLLTPENRNLHAKLSKQVVELSKAFREYYQMEFEILGYGKSEEEQKLLMKNYMANSLKKLFEEFEDMPEAQKRLNDILNNILTDSSVDE